MGETQKYWPFEVLPPDQRTDHHKKVIRFLEEAFSAGFKPYMFGNNFGASTDVRIGEMIHRGVDRYWEIILTLGEERCASFYVDGFAQAGEAIMRWLRGDEVGHIRSYIQQYIVDKPGKRQSRKEDADI
jgi:hypothetical protein